MPWAAGTFSRANGPTGWQDDQAADIGIEAGRHDTQDNDFRDGINDTINKAGQNTPTANLPMGGYKHTGVANASANDQYAAYGQTLTLLGQYVPSGAILMYGAAAAPTGWLLCDGTPVSRTTYAALFTAISTTYGAGDGSTTFNLPDLRQRFPLGKAASGTGNTLGGTGGAIDHTHTSAAHTHTVASHTHTLSDNGYALLQVENADIFYRRLTTGVNWTATHSKPIANALGSGATKSQGIALAGSTDGTALTTDSTTPAATGTNNPPYLVVNYIIRT